MQLVQDNEWFKAIRITGPTHNLLALSFEDDACGSIMVEALLTASDQPKRITGEEVEREVLLGVREANGRCRVNYRVSKIQFVPTDTPPATIYRKLAAAIVERLAGREPFVQRVAH